VPIKSQAKSEAKARRSSNPWDDAITEAKQKIRALRYTIRVYEARKRAGDPWPGSATQH
jgi:hypothetical protein